MTATAKEQTIIRTPKDGDHPYFALCRAVPQDERLSWEARGVLCYLLSKPSDWEVRPEDLRQQCGRDKVYRILGELRKYGYLHRERIRHDDGTIEWGPYRVYEQPLPEKPEMVSEPLPEKPYTAEPDTVKPDTVKPDILHSRDSTDKRNTDKRERGATAPAPRTSRKRATSTGGGEMIQTDLTAAGTPTPPVPPAPPSPPKGKQRDPRLDHAAVVAYRSILHTTPNEVQRALIVEKVGDDAGALEAWGRSCTAWAAKGYRPQNVDGLLDFFGQQRPARPPQPAAPEAIEGESEADRIRRLVLETNKHRNYAPSA